MKQNCYRFSSLVDVSRWLSNSNCYSKQSLLHVYTTEIDKGIVISLYNLLEESGFNFVGCTVCGTMENCKVSDKFLIIVYEFETPVSFKIEQAEFKKFITKEIEVEYCESLKGIEILSSIQKETFTEFCKRFDNLPLDVKVFGGVSCNPEITEDKSFVFSKSYGISDSAVVLTYYCGDSLTIRTDKVTGWKPLGRKFTVTKSDGNVLEELSCIPAFNVYQEYLAIDNDENFFFNALEFPLFYEHNGVSILRVPVACNSDGSIVMSSDIDEGSIVRISYGDPLTIKASIAEQSRDIQVFQPDVIAIFSCGARKVFWGDNEPTYELEALKSVTVSNGFFSHGEFIRENNNLNQHNETLVIVSFKEGNKTQSRGIDRCLTDNSTVLKGKKVPLVSRLATFISATSRELESTNQSLKEAVITDGLTGLYNRKEIQSRISNALQEISVQNFSIIMIDIDNFKRVNDNYGHNNGDLVIKGLAEILKGTEISQFSAGRWGGEEFMLLLKGIDISGSIFIAEIIRKYFANLSFNGIPNQTVSVGVTQATKLDTIDTLVQRVDTALYSAKNTGRNKVVAIN